MYYFIGLKVEAPGISAVIKRNVRLISVGRACHESVRVPVGLDYPDLRVVDAFDNLEGVIGAVTNIDNVLIDYR